MSRNLSRSIVPVVLFVVAGAMIFFLFLHNKSLKVHKRDQQLLIAQQSQLIDSLRIRSLSNLMPSIISRIDEELKNNPNRTLSDETISRMAALSYSFRPYSMTSGDSLSIRKLSPERGQLLVLLNGLDLDSGTMQQILEEISFENADLHEADLSGANLSGIDLSNADLYRANLNDANLSNSNLSFAHLWGAQLTNADLDSADLSRADLKWADLNGADLKGAILFETDLASAQLRKADLQGAAMKYANLRGTFLNEVNLSRADLYRTIAVRSQLPGAILNETNLTYSNLIEANLEGADLSGVTVKDSSWFQTLNKWLVTGAQDIQVKYKMEKENIDGQSYYRLKKVED